MRTDKLVFLLLFISLPAFAQDFSLKVKNESGWFTPLTNENVNKPSFINDLDISAEYNVERNLSIVGKIQPQWYGIEHPFFSIGSSLKTDASYRFRNYDFNSSLLYLKKFYTSRTTEIDINQYVVNANWLWYYKMKQSIYFDVNYGFRIFKDVNEYRLKLINGTMIWIFTVSPYTKLGTGLFAEQFWIENTIQKVNVTESNRGMRIGPVLHFKYLKNFIFSLDYNFVSHFSIQTNVNSYEHWLKILAGKNLTPDITVLLFIDYQVRNYKNLPDTDTNLLYSSLQSENRIYLKLDYDFNESLTFFSKIGYRKDDFIKALEPISGVQTTLGIDCTF